MFYAHVLSDLRNRENVELTIATETDLSFLNRSRGSLSINRYFFERFRRLPPHTIIIESENFYFDFFLANWLARFFRGDLRFIISARQIPDPLLQSPPQKILRDGRLAILFRSADAVTVNSQYLCCAVAAYGVPYDRIHIVYSAGQPLPSRRIRFERDNSDVRLLCVAHIRPLKGQKTLIQALGQLQSQSVRLTLVGGTKDNEYERELRELIAQSNLLDRVQMIGRLEGNELAHAYTDSDIFVLPSLYEAYGIVAQEAMSFGLPVVASNVGGIPEQFSDGIEGFLVPPDDPTALAKALHKLILDPKLRAQMGSAGRQHVSELPTWNEVCERFYQVLVSLESIG